MEHKNIPIEGLEKYQVTEDGRVYNTKTDVYRKQLINPYGYCTVSIMINTKRKVFQVHRLVALAFCENDGYPIVNHIDGDKQNNHYSNLEWCSHAHNRLHSARVLGHNSSKHLFKAGNSSRSITCRVTKGLKPGIYSSFTAAAKANNTTSSYISAVIRKNINSSIISVELF
jgi:hypothetical protein